jgi:carboxymethylenebutenolidase
MPNLFFRTAHPPVFVLPPGAGREVMMERIGELTAPLTPDILERDTSQYVDFLCAQDRVRTRGPLGAVGYCFAGAVAMRCAAARPDRIGAAASFHGGGLFTETPASPHLILLRIKAWLYFAHAVQDSSMTADNIAAFNRALDAWGRSYKSEIYAGAFHSWAASDSPVYNPAQAERAFQELTGLLGETIA